jgi:tetratricopeptide (TPR) repeat protein
VHDISTLPLPAGYGRVEHPFGVLTNIPLVWAALPMVVIGLGWREKGLHPSLRRFVTAVVLLFAACALTICCHCAGNFRYQVEFLPPLVLLAVIGILSLERSLVPSAKSGQACRPSWRRAMRWGWGLLLGFSVAFNFLASVEHCAEAHCEHGNALLGAGRALEAVGQYEQALRFKPDYVEAHNNLGLALWRTGRVREAIGHYKQALQILPDSARVRYNLGVALEQDGRVAEAISHFELALRINPDMAEAQSSLARLRKAP